MQRFANLVDSLAFTQSRNRKLSLLTDYFLTTSDPDRGWALAALTDGLPLRVPLRRILPEILADIVDPVLYHLSRDYVGDTAETVALLWPDRPEYQRDGARVTLDSVVTAFATAPNSSHAEILKGLLDALEPSSRFALLKLLGGAPRVGVSARLAKLALAQAFEQPVSEIEESWHAVDAPYLALFDWLNGDGPRPDPGGRPVFRPMMLAHPIEDEDRTKLDPDDLLAEWKWDGIRVQVAAQIGEVRLFSRTGDDISAGFPDIVTAFTGRNCILDGELLVVREDEVAPFNDLQQRLNRKTVSARMVRDYPAHIRLYDSLQIDEKDLRDLPLIERRKRLEHWHRAHPPLSTDLSPLVPFNTFDELTHLWQNTRAEGIEGLMLKRKDSPYLSGRPRGHWWKWKRAPLTLDCVLMYAQRGSGKRSSYYSDYTFGVWRDAPDDGAELVPVGKAYSGFTDAELLELDRFIRSNTTDRFGPVRAVSPKLVLEVAFDALQKSTRHKSGIAMRFPRIARIRWDKPVSEADTLSRAQSLLKAPSLDKRG
ncbi:cisplatin damage response ATP-dependent DNA ligase [Filomicrobium sp.]|uniref:cisplatin damage response ATP-dependent DNA ligase n=1 Tax=Filomicrobium sp. TaxID=2024831 RepID=UPI0025899302|nr:cisplatin damage response ATP-dependent DNA ligase [Filomicrobium sp.]MCV0368783.1 cisplatin damage response ATP-dependent DNA ligase [Filomicrobium sp.]